MRLRKAIRPCSIEIVAVVMMIAFTHRLQAQQQSKPNIVVIFGDDIGYWNVGAYTHGMMGWTPNIDRIAKEGILFTDQYGQTSCTAGRAAFIMGQMPILTGMTTIGIPGSTRGIQKEDPTLAEVGRVGKQKVEDTGTLTRKRMETFDAEVLDQTLQWMDKNGKSGKPFFVWFKSTAIHVWSHPNPKYVQMAVNEGRAEEDVVRARMIEHDLRWSVLAMGALARNTSQQFQDKAFNRQ